MMTIINTYAIKALNKFCYKIRKIYLKTHPLFKDFLRRVKCSPLRPIVHVSVRIIIHNTGFNIIFLHVTKLLRVTLHKSFSHSLAMR